MEEKIPYTNPNGGNLESQIKATIGAGLFMLAIWYLFKRFRYHPVAGTMLIISAVFSVLVMTMADMTSHWAYVFWGGVLVAFVSVAKMTT